VPDRAVAQAGKQFVGWSSVFDTTAQLQRRINSIKPGKFFEIIGIAPSDVAYRPAKPEARRLTRFPRQRADLHTVNREFKTDTGVLIGVAELARL
jgi:hypothetical protein